MIVDFVKNNKVVASLSNVDYVEGKLGGYYIERKDGTSFEIHDVEIGSFHRGE